MLRLTRDWSSCSHVIQLHSVCKQQNTQLQERTIGRVRENGKKWWFVQEIECNTVTLRAWEKKMVHRWMCVCMCVCVLTPYLFSRSPRWILWNAARITHHRQPWIAEAFFKGVFIFKVRPAAGVCSAHLSVRVSGWICCWECAYMSVEEFPYVFVRL